MAAPGGNGLWTPARPCGAVQQEPKLQLVTCRNENDDDDDDDDDDKL